MLPPWLSTMPRTMCSPSPAPLRLAGSACQKGSNTFASCPASMPHPVSATSMLSIPPCRLAESLTCPPRGVNLSAFDIRLENACTIRAWSPRKFPRLSAGSSSILTSASSAWRAKSAATSARSGAASTGSSAMRRPPPSMRATSRRSSSRRFMRATWRLAMASGLATRASICNASIGPSASRMVFSGSRRSWTTELMMSRRAWTAFSATCRATSASSALRTCRPMVWRRVISRNADCASSSITARSRSVQARGLKSIAQKEPITSPPAFFSGTPM